jgi:hypothetical protein
MVNIIDFMWTIRLENNMLAFSRLMAFFLLNFLIRIFEFFSYLKNQLSYIVSESYRGHFALGLAHQIIANLQYGINISGTGFQGGWIDP